tara:strand:- start:995 stop:1354 length:360 start_codon:yes stop_codon:yes gene_type:complete
LNHFILIIAVIFSIEFLLKFNFINLTNKIIITYKKILIVINNSKISDNWKEKIIPYYAFILMKASFFILFILIIIILLFLSIDIFLEGFLIFLTSIFGILESVIISIIYIIFKKKLIVK